jgi:cell division protein FtsB
VPPKGRKPTNVRPGQRAGAARVRSAQSGVSGPRPKFTNRATILLVVFAILVISYASSMRAYLHQRSQILDSKARIVDEKAKIKALTSEKQRWNDPSFIEQQARAHFNWVMPGETAYQVLDANGDSLTREDKLTDPSTIAQPKKPAWWVNVGESVDAADHPQKIVIPTPAKNLGPKSGTATTP